MKKIREEGKRWAACHRSKLLEINSSIHTSPSKTHSKLKGCHRLHKFLFMNETMQRNWFPFNWFNWFVFREDFWWRQTVFHVMKAYTYLHRVTHICDEISLDHLRNQNIPLTINMYSTCFGCLIFSISLINGFQKYITQPLKEFNY